MRILLVRPKPHKNTIGLQSIMICEPLELEYVSAYLGEGGHGSEIIDMILEKKSLSYFVEKLKPDLVGITSYIAHVNVIKGYAKEVKELNPNIKTAVGGVHAEVVPEDFVGPNIDYIIQGNGPKVLREIADRFDRGEEDLSDINGLYSRDNPRCIKETTFDYPMPDRDKVKKYRHRYYYMFHNPCALIKTSFGCPYDCKFCFCRHITDLKYYTRTIDSIIEELKTIPEREIYIVDDDFLVDRKRILEFCQKLKEHKLDKRFLIYGRADFIADNPDIIEEFAKCGLRAVIVGLESSRQEELEKYNKKSSIEVNERAVGILQKNNVECYATLILGLDWEDRDFDSLYKWLKKLKLRFVNLQPFTPLPGTAMLEQYQDSLIIPRKQYEKWDLAHLTVRPTRMSIPRYYWNIIKLYYKITISPRSVMSMIKDYGLKENLKLSMGSMKITWQYILKMLGR